MDSSHKLDAPNDDSLHTIDQVANHSDLSTLYPHAKDQWTGDLVSKDVRSYRQQEHQDTLSFGIRQYFFTVGLLIPLPFISIIVALTAAFVYVKESNVSMFVIPGIFVFFILLGITIGSFRKLSNLFYMNALRALPYAVIMLGLLSIIVFMLYHATSSIHDYQLLPAVAIVSAATIIVSIILNFFFLRLWTTPVISGAMKILIMITLALALIGAGVYFSVF